MTTREKQLLTVDICSRLPYGVNVYDNVSNNYYKVVMYEPDKREIGIRYLENSKCIPVLFPISSITQPITLHGKTFTPLIEIAKMIYPKLSGWKIMGGEAIARDNRYPVSVGLVDLECCPYDIFDKLNEWMIDYRGLIEKDLAVSVSDLSDNPYEW